MSHNLNPKNLGLLGETFQTCVFHAGLVWNVWKKITFSAPSNEAPILPENDNAPENVACFFWGVPILSLWNHVVFFEGFQVVSGKHHTLDIQSNTSWVSVLQQAKFQVGKAELSVTNPSIPGGKQQQKSRMKVWKKKTCFSRSPTRKSWAVMVTINPTFFSCGGRRRQPKYLLRRCLDV